MLRALRWQPRRLTGNELYQLVLDETGDEQRAQREANVFATQQKIMDAMQANNANDPVPRQPE